MIKYFLPALLSLPLALPAVAQIECPYLSFWQTANGQCIDLTSFTNVSTRVPESGVAYFGKDTEIDNIRIAPNEVLGGADVSAKLINTTNRAIFVSSVSYQVLERGNPLTTSSLVVGQVVQPGQAITINGWLTPNQIRYKPVYRLSVELLGVRLNRR